MILGVALDIETDDPTFITEFQSLFQGDVSSAVESHGAIHALVLTTGDDAFGSLLVTGDRLEDGASFLLGFASPTVPFRELGGQGLERELGLEGSSESLFLFRGGDCLFRKVARWRRILSHFLFLRILRLRDDLLFFHAATVRIGESGVLLIGPKGAGKTTLSLALAAAGQDLLGDETAAYRPADGMLLPMRRPASIKPGMKARKVARRLEELSLEMDEDDILHIPVTDLFDLPAPAPANLQAVLFLSGFQHVPSLERISAGREELSSMQPIRCSGLNESPGRHVFTMIRLLGSLACYRLRAGDPDDTANLIVEVMRSHDADRR